VSADRHRLRIVALKIVHRGTLLGSVDLEFSGIRLRGCAVIHGPKEQAELVQDIKKIEPARRLGRPV